MRYIIENFKEFIDLAKINQGPDGWRIYGANPKRKNIKKISTNLKKIKRII
jgi:hypothetical protein